MNFFIKNTNLAKKKFWQVGRGGDVSTWIKGQLNLEALTHDASDSSWWYSLLKFGRCKIATLKNHAIFFRFFPFQHFVG